MESILWSVSVQCFKQHSSQHRTILLTLRNLYIFLIFFTLFMILMWYSIFYTNLFFPAKFLLIHSTISSIFTIFSVHFFYDDIQLYFLKLVIIWVFSLFLMLNLRHLQMPEHVRWQFYHLCAWNKIYDCHSGGKIDAELSPDFQIIVNELHAQIFCIFLNGGLCEFYFTCDPSSLDVATYKLLFIFPLLFVSNTCIPFLFVFSVLLLLLNRQLSSVLTASNWCFLHSPTFFSSYASWVRHTKSCMFVLYTAEDIHTHTLRKWSTICLKNYI